MEWIAFVVHQAFKSFTILGLFHLQVLYYHIHRQLLPATILSFFRLLNAWFVFVFYWLLHSFHSFLTFLFCYICYNSLLFIDNSSLFQFYFFFLNNWQGRKWLYCFFWLLSIYFFSWKWYIFSWFSWIKDESSQNIYIFLLLHHAPGVWIYQQNFLSYLLL